ncbi:putative ABC transporter ATP-binding protein [Vibrio maritimus]|uniref:Putative ABC transporter ATP-binding protein n=1 Tax=Vibrio maritimus TaxID=990268 RepID=A0A090S8W5_9VIBR|nr:putative ABC transporter ATP-binding protein [Vibrio maritimus]
MHKTYQHRIDVRFSTSVERSKRVLDVGEAFGLGLDEKEFVIYDNEVFETQQGDCIYITGQSGSGKSVLLRELARQYREDYGLNVGILDEIELTEVPLIDQLGSSTEEACKLLSRAGLNDAYLFIRKPSELSDGQRYRFKIAKLIAMGAEVLIADEFGAVLDRTSAKVVAFAIRKLCKDNNITLAVATTHKDLYWDLKPTLTIDKKYADQIRVSKADRDMLEDY